ncbi:MAG: ABC transporter ATP-binding protein, partial [Candidatus Kariarchaeaceae archaeon]
MKQENILETVDLYGGYGRQEIIHAINIHVQNREIVCIIGPNGSGKSTLIKVIYGLATHHGGSVYYRPQMTSTDSDVSYQKTKDSGDITSKQANELVPMGMAYVPQLDNVFPNLTIEENLEIGGYTLNEETMEKAKERVFESYPILRERKKNRAKTLSGGQRQMLALGRALMIDPILIILDEPSAALQPSLVIEIMDRVKELRDDHDVSVLMVEQNTKSALRISDRGYILAAGQLVHTDTADEL